MKTPKICSPENPLPGGEGGVVSGVKTRPIPFTGPMVRAILDAKKTQTRRVIKPQPVPFGASSYGGTRQGWKWKPESLDRGWNDDDRDPYRASPVLMATAALACECPFGAPGERLWVREQLTRPDGDPWLYAADGQPVMVAREDETAMLVWAHHKEQDYCPSRFMPRWASRIMLEITDVHVERVQDISEKDADAEGCSGRHGPGPYISAFGGRRIINNYATLWDSINGKRPGCAWADSPWVWMVSFRRAQAESPGA